MQCQTLLIRKIRMKKLLLILSLAACSFFNGYASQDRSQFTRYSYIRLDDRQETVRLLTGVVNELKRVQEVIAQGAEIVVDIVCYIPRTAAKLIDLTIPDYEKSIYAKVAKYETK